MVSQINTRHTRENISVFVITLCFASVDEAQGDDKRSDKHRARIADRCPAIAKVMSELAQSLQARQQRTWSSAKYVHFVWIQLFMICTCNFLDGLSVSVR